MSSAAPPLAFAAGAGGAGGGGGVGWLIRGGGGGGPGWLMRGGGGGTALTAGMPIIVALRGGPFGAAVGALRDGCAESLAASASMRRYSSSRADSFAISSANALRMYAPRSLREKKLPLVYMNDCRS